MNTPIYTRLANRRQARQQCQTSVGTSSIRCREEGAEAAVQPASGATHHRAPQPEIQGQQNENQDNVTTCWCLEWLFIEDID